MPSLLERAIRVSARLRSKRVQTATGSDDGISPEERSALAAEIDRLFTDRSLMGESSKREGHRSGIALPIAINFIALALLAGGIFFTHALRTSEPRVGTSGAATFTTAEGLVVQQVREQASKQLTAREQRIAVIERELAQLQSRNGGGSAPLTAASESRRRELERELAGLHAAANSRLASANDQLAELAAAREHELFLVRQLQAIYQTVQANLSGGRLNAALDEVAAADRVLSLAGADSRGRMTPLLPVFQAGDNVLRVAILYSREITRASGTASETAARLKELEGTVSSLQATVKDKDRSVANDQARLAAQAATIERQSRVIAEQRDALQQRDSELAAVIGSLREGIRRLRSDLASAGGGQQQSVGQAGSQQAGLVDLLSTKVSLRQAISSEEVRSAYPGLYSKLDQFFQQYGEIYAQQGRLSALKEIDSALKEVVTTIAAQVGSPAGRPAKAHGGPASQSRTESSPSMEPIAGYLTELDAVLGGMLRELN